MAGIPYDKETVKKFFANMNARLRDRTPLVEEKIEPEEILEKKREALKRRNREKLFDRQVDILVREKRYHEVVGFRKAFLEKLAAYRAVIHHVGDVDVSHLPFAIVVPSEVMSLEEKLRRIEYKGQSGQTLSIRRPELLANITEISAPRGPYIMKDIDFGLFTRGKTPQEMDQELRGQGRSPLTLDEGFALLTYHPEILGEYGVNFLGSRYAGNGIPAMYMHPELGLRLEFYRTADIAGVMQLGWGTPSCGGRIAL